MLVNNKSDQPRYIGVYLQPGVNELDEQQSKQFTKIFETPTLQHLFQDGSIEVVTEDSNEEFSFSSLSASEAIELVKGTYDAEMLHEFSKQETEGSNRKTVHDAIAKQLDFINTESAEG